METTVVKKLKKGRDLSPGDMVFVPELNICIELGSTSKFGQGTDRIEYRGKTVSYFYWGHERKEIIIDGDEDVIIFK